MEVRGVLDRIEDDKYAVILAEEIGKEFLLDKNLMPKNIKSGERLILNIENEKILNVRSNKKETKISSNSVDAKINKIKAKKNYSKFKK